MRAHEPLAVFSSANDARAGLLEISSSFASIRSRRRRADVGERCEADLGVGMYSYGVEHASQRKMAADDAEARANDTSAARRILAG